ncbi:MAG: HAD family hydrolase [Victivallaceae bacterium]
MNEVYIFDMDHTLIDADCDVSWKSYAVRHGLAPASALAEAEAFFADYNRGCLDFEAFVRFQLREFAGHTPAEMAVETARHFEEFIRPQVYSAALTLVKSLLAKKIPVAILTSTNEAIARPVADYFGISELMGTRLELAGGRYTGRIAGEYFAKEGKIAPATGFVERHGRTLADLVYYGDSINDRNVMEIAGRPVAANPSAALEKIARERGWEIVNF